MDSVLNVLRERGFIFDCSDEQNLAEGLTRPLTFYSGFDPTGPSLHVGNLVSIMAMRHLQRHGHQAIALVGGGTARIGDPGGKTTTRPILAGEVIDFNTEGIRQQLNRYLRLDGQQGFLVDNKDWLLELRVIPFLREIGRHFSVNQMLAAEVYRSRLEGGLTFLEFNYLILQGFDFLHLFREHGCVLYVGGSDQWSNSLAGVDLIRREESKKAFTLVTPLLETSSGQKMGKTEQGAVWLDPEKTTPFEYYQFWINTDDRDVERFLALYTEIPMEEVRRLGAIQGEAIREAKEILAVEATTISHGREAAEAAQSDSRALFGRGDAAAAPAFELTRGQLTRLTASNLLVLSGLCESRNAARRLIEQGGASIDDVKVTSPDAEVDVRDGTLVRAGKKRFLRVTVADA